MRRDDQAFLYHCQYNNKQGSCSQLAEEFPPITFLLLSVQRRLGAPLSIINQRCRVSVWRDRDTGRGSLTHWHMRSAVSRLPASTISRAENNARLAQQSVGNSALFLGTTFAFLPWDTGNEEILDTFTFTRLFKRWQPNLTNLYLCRALHY